MKFGLSTYTLTWSIGVPGYSAPVRPLDAIGLIELAASHGLELVQIADNLPLQHCGAAELATIRKAAESCGVRIEIGTRGTEPAHLLRYLSIAQQLDAVLVRTLITRPGIDEAGQEIRSILPAFEAAGVTLAIENHGLHPTAQLAGLLQGLGSAYAGCCLDTVNSFGALEGPEMVIQGLAPFIVNLHIKDFEITRVDHQMGFVILGTPAGAGRLDIPGLWKEIMRRGRIPTAILELWTPYQGSVEDTIALENRWLAESIAYLNSLELEGRED